ncbi:ricin-type beta-trefoil lectin domain protein [Kutzneria sp. NPDC052558]|uniref:ricin-type beta-trefoil lectin domain protein n=1 Tax=Kutzneria sp. NPDC052558 TaxID=3364121 RepID=UPI0037CCA9E2
MTALRRAVILAVGMTLGISLGLVPVTAVAKPASIDSVQASRPGEAVPKDRSGRLLLYVDGDRDAVTTAVRNVGGVVNAAAGSRLEVALPPDKLADLAKQPSVKDIRRPERAIPMAVTSEGVAASGADQWIAAGKKGAGVKVGVLDVGFTGLEDAQQAGELPAVASNMDGCRDTAKLEQHGTAVAEVVHDMAPEAQLFLACIDGPLDMGPAADWLRQQGVQVITASIGFLTSGRGDGSGDPGSPADVVRASRQAGIVWSVAAGNLAQDHFAGNATDANGDGFVEFNGTTQNNGFSLEAGRSATVGLRWDAWPKSTDDLDVYVMKSNHAPTGPADPEIAAASTVDQRDVPAGGRPTEEVTFTNTGGTGVQYWIYVKNNNTTPGRHFDLFVSGTSNPLQFTTAGGSVTEPATSPYALAVGATEPNSGVLEAYSGQGPTIDGRQKPDLVGSAKVSTFTYGSKAFTGTSASAAHVAGAAALLKSANPQLDAAQLESTLLARTNPKRSDNQWGKGTLALGPPDSAPAPAGSGFTALTKPNRILSTFDGTGGHSGPFAAGEVFTLPMPGVATDTTAVVLTITGYADAATGIDLFAANPTGGNSPTSHLPLAADQYASVTVVAPLGADRAVRVRNKAGKTNIQLDLVGYFNPGGGSTYFPKPTASRILDTRGAAGGMPSSPRSTPLGGGEDYALPVRGVAGVPQDATSVVVNLTGLDNTLHTWITAYGQDFPGTSTLVLGPNQRRTGLAIVPVAPDGRIRLRNGAGLADAIVDMLGWFGPGQGGRYVSFPDASRVLDTANGTGVRQGAIEAGETVPVQVGGFAGVSGNATAAVLTVAGTENMLGSDLSLGPAEAGLPTTGSVAMYQRLPGANTVFAPLGDSGLVDVRNERGHAQAVADVAGYFVGGSKAPAGGCVTPRNETGFTGIFDGRVESGLPGWQVVGAVGPSVEGCELVTPKAAGFVWYPEQSFRDDYTVRLDFNDPTGHGDSGIYLGFGNPGSDSTAPGRTGVEVRIGAGDPDATRRTGGIAGLQAPSVDATKPAGQWNSYEITFAGNRVTVVLNGQKVNDYTITDPARLHPDTYLGIQSSGSGDSVRLRDVRVRRNSPLSSGSLTGVNGKCLDVTEGDTNGTAIEMWSCNGEAGQVWASVSDGSVQAFGRCLDVKDGASGNGTAVQLWSCNGTYAQQWLVRPDGTIYSLLAAKCLTAGSGSDGAGLVIRDCGNLPEQQWRPQFGAGRDGALVTTGKRCVDVTGGDPNTVHVTAFECQGSINQEWTLDPDGSVRSLGKCLDANGRIPNQPTVVQLAVCSGATTQKWSLRPDDTLVGLAESQCLTTMTEDSESSLMLTPCAGKPAQQWKLTARAVATGKVASLSGKCLSGDAGQGTAQLAACVNTEIQAWQVIDDGQLMMAGRCLEVGNGATAENSPVGLGDCTWGGSQRWMVRPDGSLANQASGKCLTPSGNGMVIATCTGASSQRWALLRRQI